MSETSTELAVIENQLGTIQTQNIDVVSLLLNDKRSENTRRAYQRDLIDFLGESEELSLEARAGAFLAQSVPQIRLMLLAYKENLRNRKLSENTINRRLAAVRSLCSFAHRLGRCASDGKNIAEGEKVIAYRDTKGVDVKTLRRLLEAPHAKRNASTYINVGIHPNNNNANNEYIRAHAQAKEHLTRDVAILHLLIENALRRSEVCKLNVSDFDAGSRSLWILGKGRGNQKERISLSADCALAIASYLSAAGHGNDMAGPLFRNLDPRPQHRGKRLTDNGLYELIRLYGRQVGVPNLAPHKLRHSAITAALDATGGDYRKVQKLSRHRNIATVMIYDDNRRDDQGEVSSLLSGLITGKKRGKH